MAEQREQHHADASQKPIDMGKFVQGMGNPVEADQGIDKTGQHAAK